MTNNKFGGFTVNRVISAMVEYHGLAVTYYNEIFYYSAKLKNFTDSRRLVILNHTGDTNFPTSLKNLKQI